MIEKTIHYCWFGGAPLPALAVRCIDSWKQQMPHYRIIRWDESNVDLESPYARTCVREKRWAFLSDYVRLCKLHEHGGIYLDVDVEVVKPMDALLHHKLFFGWESSEWINAGVIGGERGNRHLQALSALVAEHALTQRHFQSIPKLITNYLRELAEKEPGEVTLLSPESFYPYNPWDKGKPVQQLMASDITARTYSIHHWQHSWKDTGLRHLLKRARVHLGLLPDT